MSLFNPLSRQCHSLQKAFHKADYLTLDEAAKVMNIRADDVEKNLSKMKAKGLLLGEIPFVDPETGFVIRSQSIAAQARTLGTLERIIRLIKRCPNQIEQYESHREKQQRMGIAKNVGKAVLHFAGNAMGGMSVQDNLNRSAQAYRYSQQQDLVRQINIRMVMDSLLGNCETLQRQLLDHGRHSFPEELQTGLISLHRVLVQWDSSMQNANIPSAWNQVEHLSNELLDRSVHFHELTALAQQVEESDSPAAEVVKQIERTYHYLSDIINSISQNQVRAPVGRLMCLLEQLKDAYVRSDDEFNVSDARSLKNIYLPMLQSIMEKYMKYEINSGNSISSEKVHKTISVLENELPKALSSIRDDLLNRHTSSMEDEAAALRQKLAMDGLL